MPCQAPCRCLLRTHFFNGKNGRLAIMLKLGDHEEQKEKKTMFLGPQKIKVLIENVDCIIPNFRTAVLQVFDCQFPDFSNNDEICEAFRAKLSSVNIPHCFLTDEQVMVTTMLVAAKVDVNLGEKVIAMYLHEQKLEFYEYEFTKNGYKKLHFDVLLLDAKSKILAVHEKINNIDPKYVLLSTSNQSNPLMNALKKVFQEPRVHIFDFDLNDRRDLMMVEYSKWLLDNTFIKYYVIPTPAKSYKIMNTAGQDLITVDCQDVLPFTKSCILPKSVDLVYELQFNLDTGRMGSTHLHKMEQKCHRNKLTFSLDADNFSKVETEAIMLTQIESLCSNLNENVNTKNPVIGLCDNFSVICVHKEDGGYKFLNDWNGIHGNELVISFCKEKNLFGEEALKPLEESGSMLTYTFSHPSDVLVCADQKKPIFGKSKQKPYCSPMERVNKDSIENEPGYVLYDLVKIMSMPSEAIEIDDRWGFRITKDEDHPILLEFRTHNDTMKSASPAFIFALLLKEHIKVIKKEIGEKPEQLDFCILDEKYGSEEKERIKKGLEEACELLKIKYGFIDV